MKLGTKLVEAHEHWIKILAEPERIAEVVINIGVNGFADLGQLAVADTLCRPE